MVKIRELLNGNKVFKDVKIVFCDKVDFGRAEIDDGMFCEKFELGDKGVLFCSNVMRLNNIKTLYYSCINCNKVEIIGKCYYDFDDIPADLFCQTWEVKDNVLCCYNIRRV